MLENLASHIFCQATVEWLKMVMGLVTNPDLERALFQCAIHLEVKNSDLRPYQPTSELELIIVDVFKFPLGDWLCHALQACQTAEERDWVVRAIDHLEPAYIRDTDLNGWRCGYCEVSYRITDVMLFDFVREGTTRLWCDCDYATFVGPDRSIVRVVHKQELLPKRSPRVNITTL